MKSLPLRPSPEYLSRVRYYSLNLKERYGRDVARVFIKAVKDAEEGVRENCNIGTSSPYILYDHQVVLQEWYFTSGPAEYCLVFEIAESRVELVTLWHGSGSRESETLRRVWRR